MTNQNKIKYHLTTIERFWKKYPEWRLGQLLANIYGHHTDPFFWRDEELRKKINNFKKEVKKNECK